MAGEKSALVSTSGESSDVDTTSRARSAGAFRDYLRGLDNVRRIIHDLDTELANALLEFYRSSTNSEDEYNRYLQGISKCFEDLNEALTSKGVNRVTVDGQVLIANIINTVRSTNAEVEVDTIESLTEFWENLKFSVEALQIIADKFERLVFDRIKIICVSYSVNKQPRNGSTITSVALPDVYTAEVNGYVNEINEVRRHMRLVAASCGNRLKSDMISKSSHLDRLMRGCDPGRYPILTVVPDLTYKLETLLRVARTWLDRDETFVFQVNNEIRTKRSLTREKEIEMLKEGERQKQLVKSVKTTFLVCQNSKLKLYDIGEELHTLEEQVRNTSREMTNMLDEKVKKETMVDFLKISISQTQKNYNLQIKQQRILRQLKDLETRLEELQRRIMELNEEINAKESTKVVVAERFQEVEKSYVTMKVELENFSRYVLHIYDDLKNLRGSLVQLEIIQNVKTCPEHTDDFFDQPQSVKLAPSLRQKIEQRRRPKLNQTS